MERMTSPPTMESLILKLFDISAVTFGDSNLTTDLSSIVSYPSLLLQISQTLISSLPSTSSYDILCGVSKTAIPISTCVSTASDIPMVIPRVSSNAIDGVFSAGQTCLVIEDVVASGACVIETAEALRSAGMKVADAMAVIDREEGGMENLAEDGIELHAMLKMSEVMRVLKEKGRVSQEMESSVQNFLRENRKLVVPPLMYSESNLCLAADVDTPAEFVDIADKVDSQEDRCCTKFFSERSSHEDEHKMEYSNQGAQSAQFFQKARSTASRTQQRGTNFTIEEDILLASAWLNISLDAVRGNEQKHKAYWFRVWEYFHEHKNFISERSQTSLMHRWSTVQLATNKFCACFAEIELRHHSGVSDKDQVIRAKMRYRELHGSSFPFEHCWNELRDQPKWLEDSKKKKPKRNRYVTPCTSSPSTPDSITVRDDDTILDVERQPSSKEDLRQPSSKEDLSNKRKGQDWENGHTSSPFAMLLHELKEDEQKTSEKKMEIYEKTYLQEQERLALEHQRLIYNQLKEEERIILMDTSEMPPHQAEYYRRRQMKILGK